MPCADATPSFDATPMGTPSCTASANATLVHLAVMQHPARTPNPALVQHLAVMQHPGLVPQLALMLRRVALRTQLALVQLQAQLQHLSLALMQHQAQTVQQVQGECRCRRCSLYPAEPALAPTVNFHFCGAKQTRRLCATCAAEPVCFLVQSPPNRTRYCVAQLSSAGAPQCRCSPAARGAAPPSTSRRFVSQRACQRFMISLGWSR